MNTLPWAGGICIPLSENGDKEFRPNCEGNTDLIRLTDENGKQVFVFMPHAPATAPAAPAASPNPIPPPAEVSTNTDAQTGGANLQTTASKGKRRGL